MVITLTEKMKQAIQSRSKQSLRSGSVLRNTVVHSGGPRLLEKQMEIRDLFFLETCTKFQIQFQNFIEPLTWTSDIFLRKTERSLGLKPEVTSSWTQDEELSEKRFRNW